MAELVAVGRRQLLIQFGWVVLDVGSQFAAPLGMNGLVDAIGRGDTTHTFLYAAMIIAGPTINTVSSTQGFHTGARCPTKPPRLRRPMPDPSTTRSLAQDGCKRSSGAAT